MKVRMKKVNVVVAVVSLVLFLVGCSKSQDNTTPTSAVKSADSSRDANKGDLPQKSSDAVEFAIAMYVQQTGQSSGFVNISPPSLAETEIKRLSALGKMRFSCEMSGIIASVDGSKNTVQPGGHMDVTLDGDAMKCKIRIGEGSFGIKDGKVIIGEGTRLTFDGSPFVRKGGVWVKGQ